MLPAGGVLVDGSRKLSPLLDRPCQELVGMRLAPPLLQQLQLTSSTLQLVLQVTNGILLVSNTIQGALQIQYPGLVKAAESCTPPEAGQKPYQQPLPKVSVPTLPHEGLHKDAACIWKVLQCTPDKHSMSVRPVLVCSVYRVKPIAVATLTYLQCPPWCQAFPCLVIRDQSSLVSAMQQCRSYSSMGITTYIY
jgi:hypothetical protein